MLAGPRHRSGLDLGRHPRRRWAAWAAFGLVGAIVIGEVAADVVNSGPPAAEVAARTYAAAVVPIIEESTALRLWLTEVRQNAPRLGRLGLETALGRLVAGARNLQNQAASLGIPAPSPRSARLLSEVLAGRALAARLVTGGIALAIGPSRDVTAATATLVRAGGELAGSDADYASFLASLPRRVRQSASLPSSDWDMPSEWTSEALAGFAETLGSTPALLIHQSLVIVAFSLHPSALRIVMPPATAAPTTSTGATTSSTTTSTTTTSTTIAGLTTGSTGSTTSSSTTTPTTSTTTTTLQIPPAGSVSCLQPTNQVSVDVVVANAGDVGAAGVEVSATLAELSLPPAGAGKHKKPTSSPNTTPPSCGAGGAAPGGAGSAGGTASQSGGSPAPGASRTVRHKIALLPAGTSDYVAMPAMAVRGGSDYVLTVQLGSRRESVTLQVASG